MAEREQLVIDTFVDLADALANDYDVGGFLHMLMERCVEVLDVATGGVFVEGHDGGLRLAASTSEEMHAVEEAEISHGEGPCMDAYGNGEQVMAEDLRDELHRWPTVARKAVDIGLVAVYAFPLSLRGDAIGALNLYRREPGAFAHGDVRLAQAFADVAAMAILQERRLADAERRSDQLQHALDSRTTIEQAKGVLAERAHITPTEAFDAIRAYARSHNEKLRDVCLQVIETDFDPD